VNDGREGSGAAEGFAALFGRIADIFGVFDLSFFVAGAVAFGALVFGGHVFGVLDPVAAVLPDGGQALRVVVVILGSYVLGIVCFAAGRKLRPSARFYKKLPDHLRSFGIEQRYHAVLHPPTRGDKPPGIERCALLYTGLWAEVRQSKDLVPSYNLLTRYWVMAAMCDGLFAAFCLWELLFGLYALGLTPGAAPSSGLVSWLIALGLGGAAALSMLEARRYDGAQMYELCATLASQQPGDPDQP
jgi:hypothetical protein